MKEIGRKEKRIFLKVKKIADKQLDDTIKEKCLFLCYQPPVPNKLKKIQGNIKEISKQ